jgi:predicted RNase H-like HicB family nuclease
MTSFTALIDGRTGAYGLCFPDLPGCTAMGATLEGAVVNAAEAMCDWVDATIERGGAIPEPRPIEALLADPEVSADTAAGALLRSVPLVRHSGRRAKANLSIDSGILAAIDAEAKRRKLTRSAFIELMARHALPEMAL